MSGDAVSFTAIQKEITMNVVFSCFRAKNVSGALKEKTVESENFWVPYDEAYKLPNIEEIILDS